MTSPQKIAITVAAIATSLVVAAGVCYKKRQIDSPPRPSSRNKSNRYSGSSSEGTLKHNCSSKHSKNISGISNSSSKCWDKNKGNSDERNENNVCSTGYSDERSIGKESGMAGKGCSITRNTGKKCSMDGKGSRKHSKGSDKYRDKNKSRTNSKSSKRKGRNSKKTSNKTKSNGTRNNKRSKNILAQITTVLQQHYNTRVEDTKTGK